MDMIRWLASNIVVQVAWGLGLLAVLLAFIFGGGKSTEEHATAEPAAAVEEVVTSEVAVEPVAEVKAAVAAATPVVAEPVQALVATEAVTEPVPAEAPAAEEKVVEAVASATEEVVAETKPDVVEVEAPAVEEALAVEESALDTSNVADKSSEDLLMMAREAYWNNGLDEAAELYGVLIEREPTVIEHKGDLGNVFWRQGFPKKAAELYAEIAAPMIEQGNGERVSNMVGFIGLFFPERATKIRELLASN